MINDELRELADSGIRVSPVAMGCWPISGMTSLGVNENDSKATLEAAFDAGINLFDTAFCYGADGDSERLIARTLGSHRHEIVIATKCGIHWDDVLNRQIDGRPNTLRRECEESLKRLNTDRVDLLYLHAPDPNVPVAESAGCLNQLLDEGKTRSIGVSNLTIEQLESFHSVCPITAYQPPYSMLQRDIEKDLLPWCRNRNISVVVYWPLLKGLLAGQLARDHVFQPGDGRAKYPMFQGDEWQKNQGFVERLRQIADEAGKTVAQVAVNWTVFQPGITSALCGAKRPQQIQETAGAMGWRLSEAQLQEVDKALKTRGTPFSQWAV